MWNKKKSAWMEGLQAAELMAQSSGIKATKHYFYTELDGEESEFVNGFWDYIQNYREVAIGR